jgi:SAM-dependent methyltransferase
MAAKYDTVGVDYAALRRPDPRIAAQIEAALGPADTVLNVGAGAGNYEPSSRRVTALEPAWTMIAQRPADASPVVQGRAEALPFADQAFDAAMASLTVHHWSDQAQGLRELRRVAQGPVVLLTYDPAFRGFWLTDYLPELIRLDEEQMPPLSVYAQHLGEVEISPVLIPHDCTDGFLCAYWRRPHAYLDAELRKGSSSFFALGDISEPLGRLADDLQSGAWARRYGLVMDIESMDLGYRLVVAR